MWVVTDDIGVGENTQRKLVEWVKKKTLENPGNFDFQNSEDKEKGKTKQQQKEKLM